MTVVLPDEPATLEACQSADNSVGRVALGNLVEAFTVRDTIFAGNLPWIFPRSTITDLYLRVHSQRRKLISVTAPHTIDDAVGSVESAAAHGIRAKTRLAVKDAKEKLSPHAQDEKQEGSS